MAVTYTTAGDVADFLRVGIDETTTPNIAQTEKIINRMEDRIDRRTGHAWRLVTITNEHHDLPLIYSFGWGTMISLHHRMVQIMNKCSGDELGIWQGTSNNFNCIISVGGGGNFEEIPERGELYIRGHLFSVMRKNRVRITYRYGGEPGDCPAAITVPFDIEDAAMKLTAADLLTSSFRFDILPRTDLGFDLDKAVSRWREDVDRIIRNREDMFAVTT